MTSGPDRIITPASDLWAVVRHSDPPDEPPDHLVPYVVARRSGDRVIDWALTDDVLAFADADVPTTFQRWRSTWERVWPLDPHAGLVRLTAIARSLAGELGLVNESLLHLAAADEPSGRSVDEPAELLGLADELERVRDAIREQDRTAYGFVDATEGRDRVGLARAWSPSGDPELIAADDRLEVWMRPDSGLVLELAGPPPRTLVGVDEVTVHADSVEVRVEGTTEELPAEDLRAVTWIVPGATRWRVRRVPEVLVWARTFGGLTEACRYAAAIRRTVMITDRQTPVS